VFRFAIPFIACGGILIATGNRLRADDVHRSRFFARAHPQTHPGISAALRFALMLPGPGWVYRLMRMASRPGLVPGFIGGYLAGQVNAGFFGALIAGLLAGYIVNFIKKVEVPSMIRPIMADFLLFRLSPPLIVGGLMLKVIGLPSPI